MLRFTRAKGQIIRSSVLPYDHPLVHFFLWSNEKPTAFLDVIQSIGRRSAAFHCHQDTVCPASDLAFERPIFLEKVAHRAEATSKIDQVRLKTNQSSGGDHGLDQHAVRVMTHVHNFPLPAG